jgi:hypothetical protein
MVARLSDRLAEILPQELHTATRVLAVAHHLLQAAAFGGILCVEGPHQVI